MENGQSRNSEPDHQVKGTPLSEPLAKVVSGNLPPPTSAYF